MYPRAFVWFVVVGCLFGFSPNAAGQTLTPRPAPARTWSMGQPPIHQWHTGSLFDPSSRAVLATLGVQKDVTGPMAGLAALRVEGAFGASRDGAEGRARALLVSPLAKLHIGVDYDARLTRADLLLGARFNVRRGGVLGRGTRLRVDWMPGRGHAWLVGIDVPIHQRAGTTRPPRDRVDLPNVPAPRADAQLTRRLASSLTRFRAAVGDVTRLVMPLRSRLGGSATAAVAADVAAVTALAPADVVLARMMDAWTEVFATAMDTPAATAAVVATRARRIALEDILIPFDGIFAERRDVPGLTPFVPAAVRRFDAALADHSGLTAADRAAASQAFAAVITALDGGRAYIRDEWRSDRRVFVPLQWALAPEESDSQAELDDLLSRATGQSFIDGNRIFYVINEAFQFEFRRTVRQARQYHVLWIHDVSGKGDTGPVDRVTAMHVAEYFNAITERVKAYDATGALTQYFILLDQFFYAANSGRLWMNMLENPLGCDITLGRAYAEEEGALRAAQQSLRAAVAASTRLQADRARLGDDWLRNQLQVHVNITHPSDFSFWAAGMIKGLGIPDNLMRDHRKIVFYDISEDDPYRGEVMFTGMGLGEHYAGRSWEDRALIVEGPAALDVKRAVRRLFAQQRVDSRALPDVFQERPLAADYAMQVDAERQRQAAGPVPPARVLTAHNDVGYGRKDASLVKALTMSLMPRGSVVIVPDSLWEDYLMASLLMGTALRGGRVMVIAPALANAPAAGWPTLTRTHMLFSRLLALSTSLDTRLARERGLFKIGLFSETSAVGDQAGRARELQQNLGRAASWFRAVAPLTGADLAEWAARAEQLTRERPASYLVTPAEMARPKLHMKGLYAATSEAWDGVYTQAGFTDTLFEYLNQRSLQVNGAERDVRALPRAVWVKRRAVLDAQRAAMTAEARSRVALYLQIGSYNMNDRSMLLDGEVVVTVSGDAAMSGMLDFLTIAGLTTWIDRQAELDALLPPPSALHRLLARWARSIL